MKTRRKTAAELSRTKRAGKATLDGSDDRLTPKAQFGSNPGDLRMLGYAPEDLPPGAPLVVVLHGCTQRAGGYARAAGWLTLAERHGFAVLAPEQERSNNPNLCFNWFQPEDARRGAGELASIHAMTCEMVRVHTLDPSRIYVTGLSAGGAMAAALLASYPETYAGGAVVAGLPFGIANNLHEALAAMRGSRALPRASLAALVHGAAPLSLRKPRLTIWHGDADTTVGSSNAMALALQWATFHGLDEAPADVVTRGTLTRSTWGGLEEDAVVELNMLRGFAHGAPISSQSDDPIGEEAPFVLEAGVSSSLEILRFWEVAPRTSSAQRQPADAAPPPLGPGNDRLPLGEKVLNSISPHVSDEVRLVIGKAFVAAGLMRR